MKPHTLTCVAAAMTIAASSTAQMNFSNFETLPSADFSSRIDSVDTNGATGICSTKFTGSLSLSVDVLLSGFFILDKKSKTEDVLKRIE